MDIGLSRQITVSELESVLRARLPASTVRVYAAVEDLSEAASDITVVMVENPSEFPVGLDIGVALGEGRNMQHWLLGLACVLSIGLACRTICDGTGFGDDESPYWSVIWEWGVPYLADDMNSMLCDGEGGPVRIIRCLADHAQLVNAASDLSIAPPIP